METPRVDKALALAFHGWSGTGKNFVARMLAENLYRDGLRSDCVRMLISTFHFPHPKYVDAYKVRPQCWEPRWPGSREAPVLGGCSHHKKAGSRADEYGMGTGSCRARTCP